MARNYIELAEIDGILDEMKSSRDAELDIAMAEDELSDEKLRRIIAERATIKRIKDVLDEAVKENKEDE